MGVWMIVGFPSIPWEVMVMLVVCVMEMRMGVGQHLVLMRMYMAFGEVQPDATGHERPGD